MSWGIAGDWLAVFGLILLTFGTAAQAWGNLAEFKSLQESVDDLTYKAAKDAAVRMLMPLRAGTASGLGLLGSRG